MRPFYWQNSERGIFLPKTNLQNHPALFAQFLFLQNFCQKFCYKNSTEKKKAAASVKKNKNRRAHKKKTGKTYRPFLKELVQQNAVLYFCLSFNKIIVYCNHKNKPPAVWKVTKKNKKNCNFFMRKNDRRFCRNFLRRTKPCLHGNTILQIPKNRFAAAAQYQ